MRRKEMVYKVKAILDNLEGVCTNKLLADSILTEIEKSGMLPPFTKKVKQDLFNFDEWLENVNEWDDEK